MVRRSVLIGVGAALVSTGAIAAFVAKPSAADRAIREYAAAGCLWPRSEQGTLTWNHDLELPHRLKINVSADASVGGLVLVRYPDGTVRHVTMLRDYVYPRDIRLTSDARTLWILNRGFAAGIWLEAHLYEYDISSRILVRDLDVAPDDLPQPCPVNTARTAAQPTATK